MCLCKDAIEDRLRGSTRTNVSTDDSKKCVMCVKDFLKNHSFKFHLFSQNIFTEITLINNKKKKRKKKNPTFGG